MCSTGSGLGPACPAPRQSITHKAVMPLTREAEVPPPRPSNHPSLPTSSIAMMTTDCFSRESQSGDGFTRCAVLNRQMEHGKALYKNNGAI